MKSAIIVHGKPSKSDYDDKSTPSPSNSLWLPWLQKQLLHRDITTQTPEMLNSYQPDYHIWSQTFEQYKPNAETMLIGHSIGGGFLIQWLSQNQSVLAGHVFLVAPSFGDTMTPDSKYDLPLLNGFFNFTIDPDLPSRLGSLHLIFSDNDNPRVNATVDLLRKVYPDMYMHEFSGYGHFTEPHQEQGYIFPELLLIIDQALNR